MTRHLARAGVLALSLAVGACALTFDSRQLGVRATMAEPAQAPSAGNAFRVVKHPVFLFWGAIPVAQPSLEDVLAGQVGPEAGVANLRITVRSRWTDVLVTVLTAGIITPRSVTFEGVVVP